jgi:tyrosine-protein kinase Etk/Wzc
MASKSNKPHDDDGIDFTFFFVLLYRSRLFIIIFTSCLSLLILVFVYAMQVLPPEVSMLPDIYRAYSTILVSEESTNDLISALLFPATAIRNRGGFSFSSFSYGELASSLIKSKSIIDTLSEEFDIAKRYRINRGKVIMSRGAILRHLKISFEEKTMMITVAYEDYDPIFATKFVNRLVDELKLKFNTLDVSQNSTEKQMLDQKIVEVRERIDELEDRIKRFQKKYGFLTIESLADEQTVTLVRLRTQLINKEMEIETKRELSNIEDPEMKKLFAERDSLKKLVDDLEMGSGNLKKDKPSQRDLPDLAQQYSHLQRALEIQVKIYEILNQQHELLRLSLPAVTPMFQIIDRAEVPDMKFGPTRSIIVVVGFIASLFITIVLVVMFNAIKELVKRVAAREKEER